MHMAVLTLSLQVALQQHPDITPQLVKRLLVLLLELISRAYIRQQLLERDQASLRVTKKHSTPGALGSVENFAAMHRGVQ